MKATPILILVAVAVAATLALAVAHLAGGSPAKVIDPPDESEVECTAVEKGITYKLYHADLYRVNERSGKWEFVDHLYDPDFYKKNYVERDGKILRKADNGELIPVKRKFSEDFENATSLSDLIGVKRGWTEVTLQSPKAPSVKAYVALRNRILKGQSDFLDNRVEPTTDVVHSGRGALKTYSVPPSRTMVCAKASLSTELLHFTKGDDYWFSGWYYIAKGGMPLTLMDLETTWIKEHPGMRIMIEDGAVMFELKSANKPKYRQPKATRTEIPIAQWVHLKARLHLSEKSDGKIELWQDGKKLIDEQGQTLPLAHAIYNSLEIGISAHSFGPSPATVYVDDVEVSDKPIER